MHKITAAFAALLFACVLPGFATAGDLWEPEGVIVEDEAPVVVEHERLIVRRYYPHSHEDTSSVEVYEHSDLHEGHPDRHYWHAGDEW